MLEVNFFLMFFVLNCKSFATDGKQSYFTFCPLIKKNRLLNFMEEKRTSSKPVCSD